jgi:hypothetical protein
MVTLRGFLSSEVLRSGRAMTDLNTGVTDITSIARVTTSACEWSVIIVIINNDGLTNDLLQSLVVVTSLSTPLDELLETAWLNFHANAFPITERAKKRIIVSVCVSNPCNDGELHASGERDVSSTANTLWIFRPRVSDNRIKIMLWDLREQLLDRSTNLFRRLFVPLHSIVVKTHLCKGLGHNAIVLLLLQIGACDEGTLVRKKSQGFASCFDYLAAKVIPNTLKVMWHFGWISSHWAYWCGLLVDVSWLRYWWGTTCMGL